MKNNYYEIKIMVIDKKTNKQEKPTKFNTFFDKNGFLKTLSDSEFIEYEIRLSQTLPEENSK